MREILDLADIRKDKAEFEVQVNVEARTAVPDQKLATEYA